jgi:N-acetylglucosamine kinase-like BadF-type ATPase
VTVALGIDTGGTYTDAVLVKSQTGEVLSTAKALTTKHDLSIGIQETISAALKGDQKSIPPETISMIALSTTLATNAIAESHGAPVRSSSVNTNSSMIWRPMIFSISTAAMTFTAMKSHPWMSRPPKKRL